MLMRRAVTRIWKHNGAVKLCSFNMVNVVREEGSVTEEKTPEHWKRVTLPYSLPGSTYEPTTLGRWKPDSRGIHEEEKRETMADHGERNPMIISYPHSVGDMS
ncbi:hypothetical protein NDU88_002404 [Pleurodeles waltl]|uniref:Uncharacterized protein n=1 Tax=Pleurodeles waltl TaxID=8319 RepID=A0AAV7Q6Z6_PLEWA|nr:hypothetical protein NDU88_002404 [Pleurodeles waltl]